MSTNLIRQKKLILTILDGWGYGKKDESDVIHLAETPCFDRLLKDFPNATLRTDGAYVGLPDGQMGNSEVGHLNIGAGRVVLQELVRINEAIEGDELATNMVLLEAFKLAKIKSKDVHFIGLVSEGGIHSHQDHLVALCKIAKQYGVKRSFIHAFTDGRDTDPRKAHQNIKKLLSCIKETPTKLASLIGRYYAMDRDHRWERIQKAYALMVHGNGKPSNNVVKAIEESYEEGVTDEFIEPISIVDEHNNPTATIKPNDIVICFNFRTDRCRQITTALHQKDFPELDMNRLPLHYLTMTNYDQKFKNVNVIFEKAALNNTLGEVISKKGLRQIRIAETEKYPHVTYFFSGGLEEEFKGEKRIMIPSPKVATYDMQPEMSAEEVKNSIIEEINRQSAEFICLNFANPDMVGHTGVVEAIKKAVQKVDSCLDQIINNGLENDYSLLIIADHGNADCAINKDGSPNTAHTKNPVPVILIDEEVKHIKSGKLADIAPTILDLMKIDIPKEMTGDILLN